MKYRVLKNNGRFYPQCKKSLWPFWLYIDEDVMYDARTISFTTAVQAIDYCLDLIESESIQSKKSAVVWEFDGKYEEYK